MAWVTIVEANSLEELKSAQPAIDKIPHNNQFRVIIDTPWYAPIGPLFDLAGAEWAVDMFYSKSGAILEDIEGVGLNTGIMHFRANAVPLLVFIPVLILVLGSVAGLIITAIKIDWDKIIPQTGAAFVWPLVIGGVAMMGIYAYSKR